MDKSLQTDHQDGSSTGVASTSVRSQDRKIFLMVAFAAIIAIVLVAISLQIYYRSGAYQLDLSRPEYDQVRDKIGVDMSVDTFSSTGAMDSATYTDFDIKYDKQIKSLKKLDVYSSESLSDQALGLPDITN